MSSARAISEMLSAAARGPEGPEDAGFHTGVILAWDSVTGANTVDVGGSVLPDVRTLSSGIGIRYNPGETVVLIRKQSQFFILGKVGSVGGSAGSGLQSVNSSFVTYFGTGGVWVDHPTGAKPVVSATVGSSRSALVFFRCNIKVKVGDSGLDPTAFDPQCLAAVSFAVSGASTIAPDSFAGQAALLQSELHNALGTGLVSGTLATVSGFMPMTASQGLNAGLNTFTMKYRTPQSAEFQVPVMTVIPL